MSRDLIAVDPGVHDFSYAIICDGELIRANKVESNRDLPGTANIFREILQALIYSYHTNTLIVEHQYIAPHSRARASDVIDLATIAGALISVDVPERILVKPSTWKGSTPKKIHQARLLDHAPEAWRAQISAEKDTDILDAIGIAIWAQKIKNNS